MAFNARRWGMIVDACLIVLFLGSTLWFGFHSPLFVSPDETANAFFVRTLAQTGNVRVEDALLTLPDVGALIHPRSMLVQAGALVPVSFLGLPVLYGFLSRLLGASSLILFTPLIAVGAMFAWRALLRQWVSPPVAHIASWVLLLHPAFWYYAARGLMHNVLFLSLVIFACASLMVTAKQSRISRTLSLLGASVSGACFVLALMTRTSEAVWLIPLLIIMLVLTRHTWNLWRAGAFLFGGVLCLIPWFLFQHLTYGGALLTGYTLPPASSPDVIASSPTLIDQFTQTLQTVLFPFGIHLKNTVKHVGLYLGWMFWWLTIPAAIGAGMMWLRGSTAHRRYILFTIALTAWLGLWYGSWRFHDNPDPTQITIANSYVRYWLPLFLLSTPFIATAVLAVGQKMKTTSARVIVVGSVLCALIGLNTWATVWRGQDALIPMSYALTDAENMRAHILARTPENAVIIVDRADKIVFPARRVITPLRAESTYAALPALIEHVPLFYVGITFPPTDFEYLNQKKLANMGLRIEVVQSFGQETLYRIEKL